MSTLIALNHVTDTVTRALGVEPELGFSGGTVISLWARLADGSGRVVQIGDLNDPLVGHRALDPASGHRLVETHHMYVSPEGFTVLTYKDEDTLMSGGEHLFSSQIEPNLFDLMEELRRHVYEAREPRSYCIGLPVTITVHADGRVEHEVDLSEATDLDEGEPTDDEGNGLYTVPQIDADMAAVEAWLVRDHGFRTV